MGPGVLKPTSALNGKACITINSGEPFDMGTPRDFLWDGPQLDGSLTSGSVGVLLGGNALSGNFSFRSGRIRQFRGRDGYGLHVRNVVQAAFHDVVISQNQSNVLIEGGGHTQLPTTVRFSGSMIRWATQHGMVVRNVIALLVDGRSVIEGNGEHAILVQPGTGQSVEQLVIADTWFEDNWRSVDPATRATKYAILVDGTTVPVYQFQMRRCRHGELCKVADLRTAVDAVIDSPWRPGALPGDYRISAGSTVHLCNWPTLLPVSYVLKVEAGAKALGGCSEQQAAGAGASRGPAPNVTPGASPRWENVSVRALVHPIAVAFLLVQARAD
jgi:hypothetical protein